MLKNLPLDSYIMHGCTTCLYVYMLIFCVLFWYLHTPTRIVGDCLCGRLFADTRPLLYRSRPESRHGDVLRQDAVSVLGSLQHVATHRNTQLLHSTAKQYCNKRLPHTTDISRGKRRSTLGDDTVSEHCHRVWKMHTTRLYIEYAHNSCIY